MGTLEPNASYIYERADGVVYKRKMGELDREAIGWDYDPRTEDGKPLIDHLKDGRLWNDIRKAAATDPELQELLERVKIYYHLKYNDAK
jgi:hypothetical protein